MKMTRQVESQTVQSLTIGIYLEVMQFGMSLKVLSIPAVLCGNITVKQLKQIGALNIRPDKCRRHGSLLRILWSEVGPHGRTVDPMASLAQHKNCKLQRLANEFCLVFIVQSKYEGSYLL